MDCALVAFDLDGTLLDDKKRISGENLAALTALAEKGVLLVPATGRIVSGVMLALEGLPQPRWCICVNGACVYDMQRAETVHRAEIPLDMALEMCAYMDGVDALYDCYQDNWGYMTRGMYDRAGEFYADDPGILRLIKNFRQPVDSLPEYLRAKGRPVQKLQMHFKNPEERKRQLALLPGLFPELAVTSSLPNNIEINHCSATKGRALAALCRRLGLDTARTMAFGDGSNDLDMLLAAGLGVAMGNAADSVKAAADFVTLGNNESGVACAVNRFIFGKEST